ncbi:perlucin-like [Anopheles coustani]|uniref:perlucin-like n=1 Tax=Anopheles coustani TaxID=139045 RepID=UPI002659C410|nr:perlucin-like [Anopheles coustani]
MWCRSQLLYIFILCLQILQATRTIAQESNRLNSSNNGASGKSYVVINEHPRSFFGAWRFCMVLGMKLATITSVEDSKLIDAAIQRSSNTKGPWWIAGTDLGLEGFFVWISTNKLVGHPTGYLNYSPGQPDNAGGNEHCLEIGRWGGVAWNDAQCEWSQRFICELQA